jgi:hypothetical protein
MAAEARNRRDRPPRRFAGMARRTPKALRTSRERLRANPRRCLAGIGNGWTFDPLATR